MGAISILPDRWRVYFSDAGDLAELGPGEAAPEGTSVFAVAPVPLDLSLVGLSGRRLDQTSAELMQRAHEIVVGWEGVMRPGSTEPEPWAEETVHRLPRTALADLITFAQAKTWGGPGTEGNESSRPGLETNSSDGSASTDPAAAPSGASS